MTAMARRRDTAPGDARDAGERSANGTDSTDSDRGGDGDRDDQADESDEIDDIDADLRMAPGDPAADAALDAPLSDELDLHTFLPRECADVVAEYVRAAQEAGMTAVRIVHGKGTGTLRRIVHSVLAAHPAVRAYRLADQRSGSWGATLVDLHPLVTRLGRTSVGSTREPTS